MPHVVHVLTVPDSLVFFEGQPEWFEQHGVTLTFVASPGPRLDAFASRSGVETIGIPMQRQIAPIADLVAVARLWWQLRRLKPDVVHSHTPKGGLLGMLAASLARVPVRVYHIHGLPLVTAKGLRRVLLRASERMSCRLATDVLCVSRGVRDVAVQEELNGQDPIDVLLNGSINGVDATDRFNPEHQAASGRAERERLGIPCKALVFGFVGRLVRDKGVVELVEAWQSIRKDWPSAHLVVGGTLDDRDAVPNHVREQLESDPQIHLLGFRSDVERVFAALDVLVLPTYREGFPVVPLEAAAMSLPVLTTHVPGCTEAVVDGVTGMLVPPADASALADAMHAYAADPLLRRAHGIAGRKRVLADYAPRPLWEALRERYARAIARFGAPRSAERSRERAGLAEPTTSSSAI